MDHRSVDHGEFEQLFDRLSEIEHDLKHSYLEKRSASIVANEAAAQGRC